MRDFIIGYKTDRNPAIQHAHPAKRPRQDAKSLLWILTSQSNVIDAQVCIACIVFGHCNVLVLNNTCSHAELDHSLFGHLTKVKPSTTSSPASGSPDVNFEPSQSSSSSTAASRPFIDDVHDTFPRPDHLWSFVKAQGPLDWRSPITTLQGLFSNRKQSFLEHAS